MIWNMLTLRADSDTWVHSDRERIDTEFEIMIRMLIKVSNWYINWGLEKCIKFVVCDFRWNEMYTRMYDVVERNSIAIQRDTEEACCYRSNVIIDLTICSLFWN